MEQAGKDVADEKEKAEQLGLRGHQHKQQQRRDRGAETVRAEHFTILERRVTHVADHQDGNEESQGQRDAGQPYGHVLRNVGGEEDKRGQSAGRSGNGQADEEFLADLARLDVESGQAENSASNDQKRGHDAQAAKNVRLPLVDHENRSRAESHQIGQRIELHAEN